MTPGLCIWEMHTATLLIIFEDLIKYYNNIPESTILAFAATPIHTMSLLLKVASIMLLLLK